MIFDKEEWRIVKDYEYRLCAGFVSNKVVVSSKRGKTNKAYITVPTQFFHFVKSLVPDVIEKVQAGKPIYFYLEEEEADVWYFGFVCAGECYDLWMYKDKPFWA